MSICIYIYIYIYIYLYEKSVPGLGGLCSTLPVFRQNWAVGPRRPPPCASQSGQDGRKRIRVGPRRSKTPPRRPKTPPRPPKTLPRRPETRFWWFFQNRNGTKLTPKPRLKAILCRNSLKAKKYYFRYIF